MKIDENRRTALLDSILKSDSLSATDAFLSKAKETSDKLELSVRKNVNDRTSVSHGPLPIVLSGCKNNNFIDKVELSTKNKTENTVKVKNITNAIITQETIDALLKTEYSETYNAGTGFVTKTISKSRLVNLTV